MYRVNYNGLVGFAHSKDIEGIIWLVRTIEGIKEVLKEDLIFFEKVKSNLLWN